MNSEVICFLKQMNSNLRENGIAWNYLFLCLPHLQSFCRFVIPSNDHVMFCIGIEMLCDDCSGTFTFGIRSFLVSLILTKADTNSCTKTRLPMTMRALRQYRTRYILLTYILSELEKKIQEK